jgi:hypothetical protein
MLTVYGVVCWLINRYFCFCYSTKLTFFFLGEGCVILTVDATRTARVDSRRLYTFLRPII